MTRTAHHAGPPVFTAAAIAIAILATNPCSYTNAFSPIRSPQLGTPTIHKQHRLMPVHGSFTGRTNTADMSMMASKLPPLQMSLLEPETPLERVCAVLAYVGAGVAIAFLIVAIVLFVIEGIPYYLYLIDDSPSAFWDTYVPALI